MKALTWWVFIFSCALLPAAYTDGYRAGLTHRPATFERGRVVVRCAFSTEHPEEAAFSVFTFDNPACSSEVSNIDFELTQAYPDGPPVPTP